MVMTQDYKASTSIGLYINTVVRSFNLLFSMSTFDAFYDLMMLYMIFDNK